MPPRPTFLGDAKDFYSREKNKKCAVILEEIMAEGKCEIFKMIGVLSEGKSGWSKDFTLVNWNDNEPKYNICEQSLDGLTMSKGIAQSVEELKAIMNEMEENKQQLPLPKKA